MAFFEVKFFSDVLGMCMSMNVVAPQKTRGNIGVSEGSFGEHYPTLYLLHGMSDDHTTWMRRTSIERYAEEHGIAVVMPTTYLGWYTDMAFGFAYRTFIGEELPKICRSFFPGMSDKREDNYISGNSMGGYGTLALALTYPETFSVAAPLSAAFDPKHLHDRDKTYFTDIFGPLDEFDGSKNDLYSLAVKVKESGKPLPNIFQWCGEKDFLIEDNRRMQAHLRNLGYNITYSETDGNHSWGYWDREIQNVLRYIDNYRRGRV
ncbi:MAG: esterase family protein [Clostridia bacterium]|nr:esterase family protein [Clostridia bacterium]